MRTTRIIFVIICLTTLLVACDSNKNSRNTNPPAGTMSQLDPRLEAADSIVVVFYKDPFGTDSLRYTRYYTQLSLTDEPALDILKKQLAEATEKLEKIKKCRSEGKIWCFSKGRIFQTLYFNSKCDGNCCHLYLIKDGLFYYSHLEESFINWLRRLKPLAVELPNEGIDGN